MAVCAPPPVTVLLDVLPETDDVSGENLSLPRRRCVQLWLDGNRKNCWLVQPPSNLVGLCFLVYPGEAVYLLQDRKQKLASVVASHFEWWTLEWQQGNLWEMDLLCATFLALVSLAALVFVLVSSYSIELISGVTVIPCQMLTSAQYQQCNFCTHWLILLFLVSFATCELYYYYKLLSWLPNWVFQF